MESRRPKTDVLTTEPCHQPSSKSVTVYYRWLFGCQFLSFLCWIDPQFQTRTGYNHLNNNKREKPEWCERERDQLSSCRTYVSEWRSNTWLKTAIQCLQPAKTLPRSTHLQDNLASTAKRAQTHCYHHCQLSWFFSSMNWHTFVWFVLKATVQISHFHQR